MWKGFPHKLTRAVLAVVLAVSMVPAAPAQAHAGQVVAGEVPAVAVAGAVWDGTVDTAWYAADTAAIEFVISTPAELAGLAAIVNGTASGLSKDDFAGKTVKLAADVALNDEPASGQDDDQRKWTPIGNRPLIGVHNVSQPLYDAPNAFKGTFDGQGHAIANIYACTAGETNKWNVNDYGGYQGLFGALGEGAVVKNLALEGGFVTGRVAGGIAALGVASSAADKPMILNCRNTATVEGNGSSSRGAGGIFGGEGTAGGSEGDLSAAYIANCYNAGAVQGKSGNQSAPLGGIAGQGAVEVYSCYNVGAVATSTGPVRGAIVGTCREGSAVVDCYGLSGASDALYNEDDEALGTLSSEAEMRALVADGKLSAAFVGGGSGFPKLFWEDGACVTTDLSALAEIGAVPAQDYTGKAVTPAVAVTASGKALKAGSDFRVTFSDNVNVGTARFTVVFIGAYSGSANGLFKIVGTSLNSATVEVGPQWIYGLDPVEPDIVVRDVTGKELTPKTDYTATFTNNTAVGTGHVVVGPGSNGNYTGRAEADFPIVAASTALAGAGTEGDPFRIGSRADFQLLSHQVNDLDDPVTGVYKLTADVDMAGSATVPEVDALGGHYVRKVEDGYYWYELESAFAGTLDGGGHTLSMAFDVKASSFGLIGSNEDGTTITVRDLNLAGSIDAPYTAAVLFPSVYADVTLENVTSSVNVTAGYRAYGLVGEVWPRGSVSISGCENAGDITGGREAAGVLGEVHLNESPGLLAISDTVNSGAVHAGNDDYTGQWAAGILGATPQFSSSVQRLQLERCANTGAISADVTAGGLVATLGESGSSLSTGDATTNWHALIGCFNTGSVTGGYAAGGLVGAMRDENRLRVSGGYNTGAISATGASGVAGGLVGGIGSGGWFLEVSGAYSAGAVTAANADGAGALLGHASVGSMYTPAGAEIALARAYYRAGSAGAWVGSLAEDETEGYYPRKGPKVSGEAEAVSEAEMTSVDADGLAARLGTQFTHDVRAVNQGYPVLFWQVGFEPVNITGAAASDIADEEYTGRLVMPGGITVTLADGTVLEQGVDFLAEYADNTEVGTATVTLTGIGRCVGTVVTSFRIVKADISRFTIADISPQWGSPASPANPSPVLLDKAGRAVSLASGFTVAYAGNDAAGQASVTVSADADNASYAGQVSAPFTVYLLVDGVEGGDDGAGSGSGSGSGSEVRPYLVGNAAELEFVARGIRAGTLPADATYQLTGDFSIPADVAMTGIGSAAHPFAGTLDGAGHTITRQDTLASGYALLHDVDGATVRGLAVAGTVIAKHEYDSAAQQVNDGGTFAGALDGDVAFVDCRNEARVSADDALRHAIEGLGGFAAETGADCVVSFTGCENAGAIDNACAIYESANAGTGGFVGRVDTQTLAEAEPTRLVFEDCVNSGAVTVASGSYAGGFVGKVRSDGYDESAVVEVSGCVNAGAIAAPAGSSQAGIVGGGVSGGDSDDPGEHALVVRMSSTGNRGPVSGLDGSAGLFGVGSGVSVVADSVYNTGAVTITTDVEHGTQIAGGLFTVVTGSSTASSALAVSSAYNAGQVTCTDASASADPLIGGIAGGLVSTDEVSFDRVFYTVESAGQGVGNASAEEGAEYAADPDGIAPAFAADLRQDVFLREVGGTFVPDDAGVNGGLPVCAASRADISGFYAAFADADASAPQSLSLPYTGSALTPKVVVRPDAGAAVLSEGGDYTVVYENNVQAGTAMATVLGYGAYRGALVLRFTIAGKGRLSDCAVAAVPAQNWTGSALEPALTVTHGSGAGAVSLARGVDYTAIYFNNVDVGTAGVLLSGIGGWSGVKLVHFEIAKGAVAPAVPVTPATPPTPAVVTPSAPVAAKKLANTLVVKAKTVTVKRNAKKAQTISAKRALSVSKAKGKVTYTRIASGSSKWLSKVNKKTGAITLKKGAPRKTLKVKVKVTAAGNSKYASKSKTVTVKVKVK